MKEQHGPRLTKGAVERREGSGEGRGMNEWGARGEEKRRINRLFYETKHLRPRSTSAWPPIYLNGALMYQ